MSQETDFRTIIEILTANQGLSLAEILEGMQREGVELTPRTLQRRLRALADQRRVEVRGTGSGSRYHVSGAADGDVSEPSIPLSLESREVLRLISRPLMQREPVPYHPDFLLGYDPGTTWYLAKDQRARLHELGRTQLGNEPAGTYARAILDRLLIDLSWASSRLEGNTYTLLDTTNLIEFGQRAEGKDALETQMILNHKHAIEILVEKAAEVTLSPFFFRNLHAALAEGLLPESAREGALRHRQVQIGGSVYTPLGVPQQVEEHFRLLLNKASVIPDPFEQSFFLLVHLPYLQPFDDVNKRVARVGANLPLVQHNLCPLSFLDVDRDIYLSGVLGVYELNRIELLRDVFLWAYERSSKRYQVVRNTLAEPNPFRIQYREEMARVLREVILAGSRPGRLAIMDLAGSVAAGDDLDRFVEMTFGELLSLHEGNIARYRIGLGEFEAWRSLWRPA